MENVALMIYVSLFAAHCAIHYMNSAPMDVLCNVLVFIVFPDEWMDTVR